MADETSPPPPPPPPPPGILRPRKRKTNPPPEPAEPSTISLSSQDLGAPQDASGGVAEPDPAPLEEDIELVGLGRSARRAYLAWFLVVLVCVGAGFGSYHLYARQQSTASALHRAERAARAARQSFYGERNRANAAVRRAQGADDRRRAEGAALQLEVEGLRAALGPELANAEQLTAALSAIAPAASAEAEVGAAEIRVALPYGSFFVRDEVSLSRGGRAALGRLIVGVAAAPVQIWIRAYPKKTADEAAAVGARALSRARANVIAEELAANPELGADRVVAVAFGAPLAGADDGQIEIVLRARRVGPEAAP